MFVIRPYTPADYDAFAGIDTATQLTAYWGEADWDPIHPPKDPTPNVNRYVAVHADSSQIVGYGAVLLAEKANLEVMVHPDWQRRGVGTLLWAQMKGDLAGLGQTVNVGPWVRTQNTGAHRWLEALGFSHVHQHGAVQLIVAEGDLKPLPGLLEQLAAQGIYITTLADEKASGADYETSLRKFHALFQEVERDVPGNENRPAMPYEHLMTEWEKSGVLPESVFLARQDTGGAYVGLSILGYKPTVADLRFMGPGCMSQHLTGVRQEYRRKNIAQTLKLRTIEYARQHGFERIMTNSNNPAMQALNRKLGFRSGPWLVYTRTIG
ncbi:MAG: GNAT family N-acetyltransferase [Armatimonas sp.]